MSTTSERSGLLQRAALSVRHWRQTGELVWVRWVDDGGYWLHTYRDARVPLAGIDPKHFRAKERIAEDAYFHRYRPLPGDTVVHVGAGAGWELNLFSGLVGPSGRVVLVEAHPRTFTWLRRRIELNRIENVEAINVAIADAPGEVFMSDLDDHMLNQVAPAGEIAVPAVTLERVLADHVPGEIDLLTMNIEGAERAALAGLGDASSRVRRLAISCHDFLADRGGSDWTRTKADVIRTLEGLGYEISLRDESDTRDWTRDYVYAELLGST